MVTTVLSMLPEEIETEVLFRLPVKSILRFSAVCRRWATLLCSKEFCMARTKLAESGTTEPAAQLMSLHLTPWTVERYTSTEVRLANGMPLLTLDGVRGQFEGLAPAPCQGLILLHDLVSGGYHVLNVATRVVTTVPPPCHNGIMHIFQSTAGLGFDTRTGEYKVVRLFSTAEPTWARCEVHPLGGGPNRHWRRPTSSIADGDGVKLAGAAVFATVYHLAPVFAGGFLHWLLGPGTSRPATAVLSFSLSEETFSCRVRQPPFDWSINDVHLTELDGRLCVVRDLRGSSSSLEIWSYSAEADDGDAVWLLEHRIDLVQNAGRDLLALPLYVRVVGVSIGQIKVIFLATSRGNVVAYDPIRGTLETILQLGGETTAAERETMGSLPRVSLFRETLSLMH